MLEDKAMFDVAEKIMIEQGKISTYSKENGKFIGRMMITLIDVPKELEIDITEKGIYAFGCSFDFYDASIGVVYDVINKKAKSGFWITPQAEEYEVPSRDYMGLFVKTLVESIDGESFGYPMYTFIFERGDFTVIPTAE